MSRTFLIASACGHSSLGAAEWFLNVAREKDYRSNDRRRLTFLAESDFHAAQHFSDNRARYAYAADRFFLAVKVLDELLQVRQHGAIRTLRGEIAP